MGDLTLEKTQAEIKEQGKNTVLSPEQKESYELQNITKEVSNFKKEINEKLETKTNLKNDLLALQTSIQAKVNPPQKEESDVKNISLNKNILQDKLNITSHAFEDFWKAKKLLLNSNDETIKKILSYPWADAYFFSIMKQESGGNLVWDKTKLYYGYGQISKVAETAVSSRLHKKLDRTKWVDNCMILVWYIASCRDKVASYVEEQDISKFALMWFSWGIEWLRWKLKGIASNEKKVSRKDYLTAFKKDKEPYYVSKISKNLAKLTSTPTTKPENIYKPSEA